MPHDEVTLGREKLNLMSRLRSSHIPIIPFLGTYILNSPESLVSYSFALPCGLVVASIKPEMLSLSFGNS